MPIPRKVKPWRGFPNANVVHGLRTRLNQVPNAARGERRIAAIGAAGAISMGTIPAGAFIVGVSRNVETVFASAATIDLGVAAGGTTVVTSAVFIPGTAPSAVREIAVGAGANMPTVDTEIWITMGTAVAATGIADILVQFYMNKD